VFSTLYENTSPVSFVSNHLFVIGMPFGNAFPGSFASLSALQTGTLI
jgi:hypothetical protein